MSTIQTRRARSSSFDRGRGTTSSRKIRVGVCARDKKTASKPMNQILSRFDRNIFDIIIFGDETLFNVPIENWPIVDCLMSWFSAGFPLDKALEYVRLRHPFCINDLGTEYMLRDRRKFYDVLRRAGIPTPNKVIVNRDNPNLKQKVVELEDAIEVDGVRINKPFVEKPVDAEDHNIYIYYPRRLGGGSKRLFRKIGNTSSKFYPDENNIRTEGSFIYEEFLMTQGTDIKVYLVGPDYAHAEARKSPVVDGIVQRDGEGKEVRFPILLTNREKDLTRRVCLAFRQNVCGFDLLRTPGKSYVCDVNGWSFVKKSSKYYDDAAAVLQLMMIRAIAPERLHSSILLHTSPPAGLSSHQQRSIGSNGTNASRTPSSSSTVNSPSSSTRVVDEMGTAGAEEELRCVAAVIRHGDRTPKQKMKMLVTHSSFIEIHRRFAKNSREEAKLKSAQQLQMVLEATRNLVATRLSRTGLLRSSSIGNQQESIPNITLSLGALDTSSSSSTSSTSLSSSVATVNDKVDDDKYDHEDIDKLMQMKAVLEKGGHFSGINRKVQLKPTRWIVRRVRRSRDPNDATATLSTGTVHPSTDRTEALSLGAPGTILSSDSSSSSNLNIGLPKAEEEMASLSPDNNSSSLPTPTPFFPSPSTTSTTAILDPVHRLSSPVPSVAALPVITNQSSSTEPSDSEDTEEIEIVQECLLVLKWGGVLTHAGRRQAEVLGQRFRSIMYPGESVGLLRLHSTYRHDLKIYSSDEGRVQMTAAAFAKGFLDLEGELTPILASLVKTVNTSNLLDDSDPAHDVMSSLKKRLKKALTSSIAATVSGSSTSPGGTGDGLTSSYGIKFAGQSESESESSTGGGSITNNNRLLPGHLQFLRTQDPQSAAKLEKMTVHVPFSSSTSIPQSRSLTNDFSSDLSPGGFPMDNVSAGTLPIGSSFSDHNNTAASVALTHQGNRNPLLAAIHLLSKNDLRNLEYSIHSSLLSTIAPTRSAALLNALYAIGPDPRYTLYRVYELIGSLVHQLSDALRLAQESNDSTKDTKLSTANESTVPFSPAFVDTANVSGFASAPVINDSDQGTHKPMLIPSSSNDSLDTSLDMSANVTSSNTNSASVYPNRAPVLHDPELERMLSRQRHEQQNGEDEDNEKLNPHHRNSMNDNAPFGKDNDTIGGIDALPPSPSITGAHPAVPKSVSVSLCCGGESLWLMCERWRKLQKDFYNPKKDKYDLSKIPDIYDCIKYDAVHNGALNLTGVPELFALAKAFADVVVSQEYGIDVAEKADIAAKIAHHLLRKVFFDMTAVKVEDSLENEVGGMNRNSTNSLNSTSNNGENSFTSPSMKAIKSNKSMTTTGKEKKVPSSSSLALALSNTRDESPLLPDERLSTGRINGNDSTTSSVPPMNSIVPALPSEPIVEYARDTNSVASVTNIGTKSPDKLVSQDISKTVHHHITHPNPINVASLTYTSALGTTVPLGLTVNTSNQSPSSSPTFLPTPPVPSISPFLTAPDRSFHTSTDNPLHHDSRSAFGELHGHHGNHSLSTTVSATNGSNVASSSLLVAPLPPLSPSLSSHRTTTDVFTTVKEHRTTTTTTTTTHYPGNPNGNNTAANSNRGGLPNDIHQPFPVPLGQSVSGSNQIFRSAVPGLVISLKQHPALAYTSRVRRKSAPSLLADGLNARVATEAPFANLAVEARMGQHVDVSFTPLPLSLSNNNGTNDGTNSRKTKDNTHNGLTNTNSSNTANPSSNNLDPLDETNDEFESGTVLVPGIRLRQAAAAVAAATASPENNTLGSARTTTDDNEGTNVSNGNEKSASPELPNGTHNGTNVSASSSTVAEGTTVEEDSILANGHGSVTTDETGTKGGTSSTHSAGSVTVSTVHTNDTDTTKPILEADTKGNDTTNNLEESFDEMNGTSPDKISSVMAAIAQDMHNITETVHQLDARLMEDSGYGEVKSLQRHVRTRLYFTSESHVHALVNTLKYWALIPNGKDTKQTVPLHTLVNPGQRAEEVLHKFIPPSSTTPTNVTTTSGTVASSASSVVTDASTTPTVSSTAASNTAPTRLVNDDGFDLLEATPELDYLTHIVFRLYENFSFPVGHPRRHRVEILFSPGTSFSPFDGAPRTPRIRSASLSTDSNLANVDDLVLPPVTPETSVSRINGTVTHEDFPSIVSATSHPVPTARTLSSFRTENEASKEELYMDTVRTIPSFSSLHDNTTTTTNNNNTGGNHHPLTQSMDDGSTTSRHTPNHLPFGSGSENVSNQGDNASVTTVPVASSTPSSHRALPRSGNSVSTTNGPKLPAVYSGPSAATGQDIASHTLPVASLLPLHMNLTLQEFEDVLAEAIYAGATVNMPNDRTTNTTTNPTASATVTSNGTGSSSTTATKLNEPHPKEEVRVRTAAALAKMRKSMGDGYFLS